MTAREFRPATLPSFAFAFARHHPHQEPSMQFIPYLNFNGNCAEAFAFYARLFGGTDRKSTRLNSSHANISYAVFCLKKKKQYPGATRRQAYELHTRSSISIAIRASGPHVDQLVA